ncbi:nitroreductase family protein [Solimonas soli]|uniref:nitroreductase family protein n=1 Tax=Solimonas soli TaxID=413479 RepID=UPI000484D2ED|nr:nitroreductase family protein [Solimonas soli]
MSAAVREPQHEIEPLFHTRWSARAFTGEAIADATLYTLFEAARWAPSGGNGQPWRFVYIKRDHVDWPLFLGFLNERNRIWASRAAALVLLVSRQERETPEGPKPARSHSFDAGAAWSNFAHQAHLLGWGTRAMGGFDLARTRTALQIPEVYALEVFIAVGRVGDVEMLPEDLRALEKPNGRLPLDAIVSEGRFAFT